MGISFPVGSPPQQAAPRKSDLDGLAELLMAVTQNRRQLALSREQLELQKQEFEQRKLEGGVRVEGAQLENAKKKRELEDADNQTKAEEAANDAIGVFLMQGDSSPEAISKMRVSLITDPRHKKYAARLDNALTTGLRNTESLKAGIAERITKEVGAGVAVATKDDTIAGIKASTEKAITDAQRAGVELRTSRVNETLAKMSLTHDPARMNTFQRYLELGQPAGQAARLARVSLPPGITPDYTLDGAGGKGGADKQKAEALGSQARMGLELVEAAGNLPLSAKADLFRTSQSKGGVVGVLTKHLLNPQLAVGERQVVQGYLLMSQAYAIHVTGATATDQQMQLFSNTIIPLASDDMATRAKKQTVLRLLPDLIARNLKPADIAARMAQEAKRIGMTPAQIKLLEAQIPVAQRYQRSPEYMQNVRPPAAGARDGTRGAVIPGLDPAIASQYRDR